MTRTLQQNVVREISYRCELYKDIEEGTILGYWTGERDTWGKFTFTVIDVLDSNRLRGDTCAIRDVSVSA